MSLSEKEKKYLLGVARNTLEYRFKHEKKFQVQKKDLPNEKLAGHKATFVSLSKGGELCGCIGNILPKKPLYQDVVDNSLLAAFSDPRFKPVQEDELSLIAIEISVLSKPKAYMYQTTKDLLQKIKAGEHGIVLQQGFNQATFLPQVWEDIPNIENFLSALAKKACLEELAWQKPGTEIFYYTVDRFAETN